MPQLAEDLVCLSVLVLLFGVEWGDSIAGTASRGPRSGCHSQELFRRHAVQLVHVPDAHVGQLRCEVGEVGCSELCKDVSEGAHDGCRGYWEAGLRMFYVILGCYGRGFFNHLCHNSTVNMW